MLILLLLVCTIAASGAQLENYLGDVRDKIQTVENTMGYRDKVHHTTTAVANKLTILKQYSLLNPITRRVDKTLKLANKLSDYALLYTAYDLTVSYPEVIVAWGVVQYPQVAVMGTFALLLYNETHTHTQIN